MTDQTPTVYRKGDRCVILDNGRVQHYDCDEWPDGTIVDATGAVVYRREEVWAVVDGAKVVPVRHETHVEYTIDDDGIHLVCTCGHDETLGHSPTVQDMADADVAHRLSLVPIRVGDIVQRKNSDLDPRPVAIVGTVDGVPHIGLQIGNEVTDPIPASLYQVVHRA